MNDDRPQDSGDETPIPVPDDLVDDERHRADVELDQDQEDDR